MTTREISTVPDDRVHVLLVDDEPRVLEGLTHNLRRHFRVSVATSGQAALKLADLPSPPAVVVSDMRMPEMNGTELLSQLRARLPDTVRILLTGQADLDATMAAVNHGQIFRFLTKPCPAPLLIAAINAAAEQHCLVTGQRVLLEQTLRGTVKAIVDTLALAHPLAFAPAMRARRVVAMLARACGAEVWSLEIAAMIAQIVRCVLPPPLSERSRHGRSLTPDEDVLAPDQTPALAERLLANIPRLEGVRALLREQGRPFDGGAEGPRGGAIPLGARILRAALDFETLASGGMDASGAIDTMTARPGLYDPAVLAHLAELTIESRAPIEDVPVRSLRGGMVVARNIVSPAGALLVAHGQEVTPGVLHWLDQAARGAVREPVQVTMSPEHTREASRV